MIPVTVVHKKPLFLDVPIEQITAANVQRLRNTPLILQSHQSTLRLTSSGGEEHNVRTINELHAAERAGYFAGTNLDMGVEAHFKLVSDFLWALTLARPSKVSHLKSIASTTLLPAKNVALFSNIESETDWQRGMGHWDLTIAQLAAKGGCKITTPEAGVLVVEAEVTSTLVEILRGDLDGDGVEDMLVWQRSQVVGASMQWSTTLALTRLDDTRMYSDVRLPLER